MTLMDDDDFGRRWTQIVSELRDVFTGWDDVRPTEKCLHCKGTGMADPHNECGFCE